MFNSSLCQAACAWRAPHDIPATATGGSLPGAPRLEDTRGRLLVDTIVTRLIPNTGQVRYILANLLHALLDERS